MFLYVVSNIYCLRYIYLFLLYIYCLRYIYLFLYVVSNIPKLHQIPGIYIMNTTTQTFITGKGNAGNKFPIWEFSIQKYTEKGSIYTFIEFHIEFILIIKTLVKWSSSFYFQFLVYLTKWIYCRSLIETWIL